MNETKPPQAFMTTGIFAKRTRLRYKALRLYDTISLLAPTSVDDQNGYRYYSDAQIEKAKLISLLQLEMPLKKIAEVLSLQGRDVTNAILSYWQEVEKEVRTKRRLVHFLEHYLEGKGETVFKVETRDVAEQKVLTIERYMYAPDLPKFIDDSMGKLHSYLEESG